MWSNSSVYLHFRTSSLHQLGAACTREDSSRHTQGHETCHGAADSSQWTERAISFLAFAVPGPCRVLHCGVHALCVTWGDQAVHGVLVRFLSLPWKVLHRSVFCCFGSFLILQLMCMWSLFAVHIDWVGCFDFSLLAIIRPPEHQLAQETTL